MNERLAPVFNSKTGCFPGTQPPELKDRVEEQNEALPNPKGNGQVPATPLRLMEVYGAG